MNANENVCFCWVKRKMGNGKWEQEVVLLTLSARTEVSTFVSGVGRP